MKENKPLDPDDYKEPCPSRDENSLYYSQYDAPKGKIPLRRIIEKKDRALQHNDFVEAKRLLEFWKEEAYSLFDKKGELSILNEMLGFYRRVNDRENCIKTINRAQELITELKLDHTVSASVIYVNMATTYRAIEQAEIALTYYDMAFDVFISHPEDCGGYMASFYNNKGTTLAYLKRFEEAEECYLSSLHLLKGMLEEYTEAPLTLVNLAHLYYCMGDYQKAKKTVERIFPFLDSKAQKRNYYYAEVLSQCMSAFEYFGFKAKEREYKKIIKEIHDRDYLI